MVTSNGNLPEELMIEILSRLSVKSLLRLRCVSKTWYTLVKKFSFVSKHLENYNKDNSRLIVYHLDSNDQSRYASLILDETLADISHQDLYPQLPLVGEVIGHGIGLFCFYENGSITLLNLATRECRTLPECKVIFPPNTTVDVCNVGFDLDIEKDDYKLMLLRTLWDEEVQFFHEFTYVALYSKNSNSWRNFQGDGCIRYYLNERYDSTYLNGICYWLAFGSNDHHDTILAFHMNNEIFHEIRLPCILEPQCGTLGLYNDSLSLLVFNLIENFDIWVMKERCWAKHLTIGPLVGVLRSLGLWKKGIFFIMSSSRQLLLYDPDIGEMKDLGFSTSGIQIYSYKESLITI